MMSPLEAELRRRIAETGPMPVSDYMALCLGHPEHGYYTTRDPFGAHGDFVTAPEVSQMFGELLGLWAASVWQQMGAPARLRLIELGPGRGTLMQDALRAARVLPGFLTAVSVHLVETSPVLRQRQQQMLQGTGVPVAWHANIEEVPDDPAIVIANEFFDALPIDQAVKMDDGWHERRVGLGPDGALAFTLAPAPIAGFDRLLPVRLRASPSGAIFEWRSGAMALAMARRIARQGGAALILDYGHVETALGDTLQAVARHSYADPLAAPGDRDVTAHVDFEALAKAAAQGGAAVFGPLTQGELLRRLGIEARAEKLKAHAAPEACSAIDAALQRLTGTREGEMGNLFKAAALAHPALGPPPGFA